MTDVKISLSQEQAQTLVSVVKALKEQQEGMSFVLDADFVSFRDSVSTLYDSVSSQVEKSTTA